MRSQSPEGSCQLCENQLLEGANAILETKSQSPEGSCQLCEVRPNALAILVEEMSQSPEGSCQLCELISRAAGRRPPCPGLNPPKGPASFASAAAREGRGVRQDVSIPRRVLPALRGCAGVERFRTIYPVSQSPEGSCQLCEAAELEGKTITEFMSQFPEGSCQLCEVHGLGEHAHDVYNVSIPRRVLPALRAEQRHGPRQQLPQSQSPEGSCQLCEGRDTMAHVGLEHDVSIPRRVLPALRGLRRPRWASWTRRCLNPPKGPASFASTTVSDPTKNVSLE